jgi:hypothetical protein
MWGIGGSYTGWNRDDGFVANPVMSKKTRFIAFSPIRLSKDKDRDLSLPEADRHGAQVHEKYTTGTPGR